MTTTANNKTSRIQGADNKRQIGDVSLNLRFPVLVLHVGAGGWPDTFLVGGGRWWGWVVACCVVVVGGWVLLVMFALGGVPKVTTGGMPRRVGVYIRIIVPVCFHSFCF